MARRPSITEINRMNKDTLKQTLLTILNDLDQESQADTSGLDIQPMLQAILDEVRQQRAERDALQARADVLAQENVTMRQALAQQQRFLEYLDAGRRASDIIMTGIPEDSLLRDGDDEAHTDEQKVALVLAKLESGRVETSSISRLGKNVVGRIRPIKMTLRDPKDRQGILANTAKLKQAGDNFRSIYVKRDMHPAFRKEWGRLREAEKRERERPENQGKEVTFDRAKRQVIVDGVVIDHFQPTFF